jgi:hypothetical protein
VSGNKPISVQSEIAMVLDKIAKALEMVAGSIKMCRQVNLPTITYLSSNDVICQVVLCSVFRLIVVLFVCCVLL